MVSNTSAATEPSFQAIEVASALTLAIGLVQLMIAVLGLDFLTTYFSEQIVAGFTTGAAVHVFVTQLKDITGIYGTPRRDGIGNAMLRVFDIAVEIYRTNLITILVSIVAMVVLYIGKKFINPRVLARSPVPIPFELLAVIFGALVSWLLHFEKKFEVRIVGDIPTGLPLPSLPRFAILPHLIKEAVPIAIVIVAVHISMAKLLAKQNNYSIDSKQLFAIFSSLFIFIVLQFGGTFLRPLPM
ncbi:inorganic anion transporter, SulP family, partial [Ostertagia ostertagi]